MLPPVLITSAVYVDDQSVKLRCPQKRIGLTLAAVEKWIELYGKSISLIICDGTNYDFTQEIKNKNYHQQVECLYFRNSSDKVVMHSKGYGEMEIIKFALENSKILNKSQVFSKCTARHWVINYDKILINSAITQFRPYFKISYFPFSTSIISIDTRFYTVNRDFYCEHLMPITQEMELSASGALHGLEEFFLAKMLNLKNQCPIFYRCIPIIAGVSGASGETYNTKLYRRFKDKFKYSILKLSMKKDFIFW